MREGRGDVRRLSAWVSGWRLRTAAPVLAGPAGADTVVSGKSAQALRCAAYIGMAAQFGYDEGYLTERDAETMTWWSVLVLDRWVPLPTGERIAAYGATCASSARASAPTA